jgi:hypothetical protein
LGDKLTFSANLKACCDYGESEEDDAKTDVALLSLSRTLSRPPAVSDHTTVGDEGKSIDSDEGKSIDSDKAKTDVSQLSLSRTLSRPPAVSKHTTVGDEGKSNDSDDDDEDSDSSSDSDDDSDDDSDSSSDESVSRDNHRSLASSDTSDYRGSES